MKAYFESSAGLAVHRERWHAVLMITFLAIALAAAPQPVCGIGFCAPADAVLLGSENRGDFSLTDIKWRGDTFRIYSGNYPSDRGGAQIKLKLGKRKATLRYELQYGSIIIPTGLIAPAFLDVMGPCKSLKRCAVRDFAAALN